MRKSPRTSLAFWKAAAAAVAVMLTFWAQTSPAMNLSKVGAFLGIQPSSKIARPYASLHETFAPTSVAWSPDGKYIADVGMYAPIVHIWDVASKKIVHVVRGRAAFRHGIAWSPDGHYLAVCEAAKDEMVSILDTKTWRQVASLPPLTDRCGLPVSPIFSPDGRYLAYTDDGHGDVFVYSTATWQLIKQTGFESLCNQKLLPGKAHSIINSQQIAFEPTQPVIAIAAQGLFNDDNNAETVKQNDFIYTSRVIFWDLRQPPPNADHPLPEQEVEVYGPGPLVYNPSYPGAPPNHAQPGIDAIAFSPDGREFAVGTQDTSVSIWNTKSEKLIASPVTHMPQGEMETVVYTANGRYLIACANGTGYPDTLGKIYFINTKTHRIADTLPVANYGGLGYSRVRNAIAVGSPALSGFKLFIWQIN